MSNIFVSFWVVVVSLFFFFWFMELGTISCRLFSDWRVRRQSGSVRAVSIAHPLLARIPATRSASLMTYIPHRLGGQNPRKRKKKKYTTSRRSPHFKQERIAVAKQKILWTQKGEKIGCGKGRGGFNIFGLWALKRSLYTTPLIVFVIHVPPSSFYRSIFRGAPDNVKETYRGSRVTVAIVNMQRRNIQV